MRFSERSSGFCKGHGFVPLDSKVTVSDWFSPSTQQVPGRRRKDTNYGHPVRTNTLLIQMRVNDFLICMQATQKQLLNTKKFPWPGHRSWWMKSTAASKDHPDASNSSAWCHYPMLCALLRQMVLGDQRSIAIALPPLPNEAIGGYDSILG